MHRYAPSLDLFFQLESTQLVPHLECRVSQHFSLSQSLSHLHLLTITESIKDRYLVSDSMRRRLCERKIRNDITILDVSMARSHATEMVLIEAAATYDKIGVIGKKNPVSVAQW